MEITFKKLDAQAVEITVSVAQLSRDFEQLEYVFVVADLLSSRTLATCLFVTCRRALVLLTCLVLDPFAPFLLRHHGTRQGSNKNVIKKITLEPAKLHLDLKHIVLHLEASSICSKYISTGACSGNDPELYKAFSSQSCFDQELIPLIISRAFKASPSSFSEPNYQVWPAQIRH